MRGWKRWGAAAVRLLLILSVLAGSLQVSHRSAVSRAASESIIQDWRTITYGADEPPTEYVVRLALQSGGITGPLDPVQHDYQLEAMAVYETATDQRVDDPALERKLVFLAQNQALMENDSGWKLDGYLIEDEGIIGYATDREANDFILLQSRWYNDYYRNVLLNWSSQTQSFEDRRRLYRDVARALVLPYIDADSDAVAIEEAFYRDSKESFEQALEIVGAYPEEGTEEEQSEWYADVLENFGFLFGADAVALGHLQAVSNFTIWLAAAAPVLKVAAVGVTREAAIEMAKTAIKVTAQNAYYPRLRLEALQQVVEDGYWDKAAEEALILLAFEMDSIAQEDVQVYWQQWLDENPGKQLLTIAGVAMGCAKIAAMAAGATISLPVYAAFAAVWVSAKVWLFIKSQDDLAVSASMALTFEHYIREHMDDHLATGCGGNVVEKALILNNTRYRAASLYYETLYKHFLPFENINLFLVPDSVKEMWSDLIGVYSHDFAHTLPPTYLIRLKAVEEGANSVDEVEAYAGWFVEKIQPLDQYVGPKIIDHGVEPSYGSYLQAFRFQATYRCTDIVPTGEAHVVIDGLSHELVQVASTTYDGIVYYHAFQYEASGLPVGVHSFHFEIGDADDTADESFSVSSDVSLGRPEVFIASPLNGQTVAGPVDIQAWTLAGDIHQVAFYVDDHLRCVDDEPPWGCPWDTEGVPNGPVDLEVVATDVSGETFINAIYVQVYNSVYNEPPSIEVLAPDHDSDYGRFTIRWEDEDLDDPAVVSLYYDNDNAGFDGVLIQNYISEDWTSDWWSWDISGLPNGSSYWVYGKIDDGINPPVYDYSPGPLTIETLPTVDYFEIDHLELTDENTGNDGDGVPDAGEELELKIYVRNKSSEQQCYVKGELSTSTYGVELTDSTMSLWSPQPDALALGIGDFRTPETFDGFVEFDLTLITEDCTSGTHYMEVESLAVEVHPDDTTAPTITAGPTATEITPDSALISWITNEPCTGAVQYGKTTAYGLESSQEDYTTQHSVVLRDLDPGTQHFYEVSSTDRSGNGPVTATGDFSTTNLGNGLHAENVFYPVLQDIFGLAWDAGSNRLWILWRNHELLSFVSSYDPASETVLSTFPVDYMPEPTNRARGLAFDGVYLWIASSTAEQVYKVSTAGDLVAQYDYGDDPYGLAWDGSHLWIGDLGTDLICKVDSALQPTFCFDAPGVDGSDLAWDGTYLWQIEPASDMVYQFTTGGVRVAEYPMYGLGGAGLAFEQSTYLWASLNWLGDDFLVKMSPVEDLTSPVITIGPTVTSQIGTMSLIGWETDEPGDATVRYGLDASYGMTETNPVIETQHSVVLANLTPSASYHYSACTQDLPGNVPTCSADSTFETGAESGLNVVNSVFSLDGGDSGITFVGADMWTYQDDNIFHKVDATTGAHLDYLYVPSGDDGSGLAWDGSAFWYCEDDDPVTESIYRIDPITGAVISKIDAPDGDPTNLAWDGTYLWVSDENSRTIYQLDPSDPTPVSSFSTPWDNMYGLATNGSAVWIYSQDDHTIYETDVSGNLVAAYPAYGSQRISGLHWDTATNTLWVLDDEWRYQMSTTPTAGPVVAKVLVNGQTGGAYGTGALLNIEAYEQYARSGYTATVSISSATDDPGIVDAPMEDMGDGRFLYVWNTAGQQSADDYQVEVRMTDGTNSDSDGLSRTPDVPIVLAPTLSAIETYTLNAPQVDGFTWAGPELWVARSVPDQYPEYYSRIDLATGNPVLNCIASENVDSYNSAPFDMIWDGSSLWIANRYTPPDITKHTTSCALTGRISAPGLDASYIAWDGSSIWLSDGEIYELYRMSTDGAVLASFPYPGNPRGLVWDGSQLWANHWSRALYAINRTTGSIEDYRALAVAVRSLAWDGTDLWGETTDDQLIRLGIKPDLALAELAISTEPVFEDVPVEVTATVHAHDLPVESVVLRFYDGDPDAGGSQIGSDYDLGTVSPGTPATAVLPITWDTPGIYEIHARVDPDNAIGESRETNNAASSLIAVHDPDVDPPTISNVNVSEGIGDGDEFLEDDEQIQIAWSVDDPGSGVSSTSVTIDGSTYAGVGSYYALVGPLPAGRYAFTIQAEDHSDEMSTYEGTVDIVPGTLEVTGSYPAPDALDVDPSHQIAVEFGTDVQQASLSVESFQVLSSEGVTVSGVVEYDASLQLATFMPYTELDNATHYTATILSGEDGPVDEYGNTLVTDSLWSFTTELDATPPVAVLSGPEPALYYKGTLGIFGSALDKNLDSYVIQVGVGSTPTSWTDIVEYSSPVADGYLGSWDTTAVPDDLYSVHLVASDTFGLQDVDTLTVYIDNTLPESAVVPLPESSQELTISVCWAGQDLGSGIDTYDVWVRDGEEGVWRDWLHSTDATCAPYAGEVGHTYYFESRARDQAGNVEALVGGDGDAWTTIQSLSSIYLPLALRSYSYAPPTDPFEPNDTIGEAWGPLWPSGTYYGYFLTEDDEDDFYYSDQPFSGVFGVTVYLTDIPPGNDYALHLYDRSGTLVASSDNPGNADEHVLRYYLPDLVYIQVERIEGTSVTQPYALWHNWVEVGP